MFRAALKSPAIQRLGNVAACTAIVCCGGLLYMQEYARKQFKKCQYFEETMRVLLENKHARALLGEPIKSGKLNLNDSRLFYVTSDKAKLTFPVIGSRQKGMVFSWCVRDWPTKAPTEAGHEIHQEQADNERVPESAVAAELTTSTGNDLIEIQVTPASQADETPRPKPPPWRVMRVEIRLEQVNDKRLLVYRTPEADQHFVDTFDDFFKQPE